eukprot:15463196-Alexandrium_andersonii.AAC.1
MPSWLHAHPEMRGGLSGAGRRPALPAVIPGVGELGAGAPPFFARSELPCADRGASAQTPC